MDLVFRNVRLAEARPADPLVDIAVDGGRIAAIGPKLDVEGPERDLAGALVCAGLVECHLHLDKAHIFERTAPETRPQRRFRSPDERRQALVYDGGCA